MNDTNGEAPSRDAGATSRIDEHVTGLREMVQQEIDSRAEYERLVEESKTREKRLTKAIAALQGEPLGAGRPPKAKPQPKSKVQQSISPQVADDLLAVMKRLRDEEGRDTVTRPELVTLMPERSGETVRRGLKLLREQERIRQAGRRGQGKTAAILYAVMPDGD